jgi:hypothetical protein
VSQYPRLKNCDPKGANITSRRAILVGGLKRRSLRPKSKTSAGMIFGTRSHPAWSL